MCTTNRCGAPLYYGDANPMHLPTCTHVCCVLYQSGWFCASHWRVVQAFLIRRPLKNNFSHILGAPEHHLEPGLRQRGDRHPAVEPVPPACHRGAGRGHQVEGQACHHRVYASTGRAGEKKYLYFFSVCLASVLLMQSWTLHVRILKPASKFRNASIYSCYVSQCSDVT